MDYLRLRQICLVAPDLGRAEEVVADVLGLAVCYRDPHVAKYGLENALWPLGDMFLEVVSPTEAGTAAGRYLDRSGGQGAYMVIFDCSDPERRAAHARARGVRVITEVKHDTYTGVQLHPRDCRAAMIEFNRTEGGDIDRDRYAPAGPDWRGARREDVTRKVTAIEVMSPDPAGLAAHWSGIVERPLDREALSLPFPEAELRFVGSGDGAERLSALLLAVADPSSMVSRAGRRGLGRTARGFHALGVEWVPIAA